MPADTGIAVTSRLTRWLRASSSKGWRRSDMAERLRRGADGRVHPRRCPLDPVIPDVLIATAGTRAAFHGQNVGDYRITAYAAAASPHRAPAPRPRTPRRQRGRA